MDLSFPKQAFSIFGVCAVVLFLLFCKNAKKHFLHFAVRAAIGSFCIVLFNAICLNRSFPYFVGLNPITILISAILGLPGVVLLFALQIFSTFS